MWHRIRLINYQGKCHGRPGPLPVTAATLQAHSSATALASCKLLKSESEIRVMGARHTPILNCKGSCEFMFSGFQTERSQDAGHPENTTKPLAQSGEWSRQRQPQVPRAMEIDVSSRTCLICPNTQVLKDAWTFVIGLHFTLSEKALKQQLSFPITKIKNILTPKKNEGLDLRIGNSYFICTNLA